jgi:ABC-type multidrug transport system ATPase subunit
MLSIANLNKTYPNGVCALKDVNLDIPKGMFGLLGPNGAGKSTLMRTIATLQLPDSGSIQFDGIDVFAEPEVLRAKLGYLPQTFGVYPGASAMNLLIQFAALKGIPRSKRKEVCRELLHLVNLYDKRNKAVSTYSGGMKRRFGIAQALLGDPKLIIVDEPTAGLDPEERHRFNNLLSEVGHNIVVMLSTHIVDDVSDLCPQMAIIVNGKINLIGAPDTLMKQLEGKLWSAEVDVSELKSLRKEFNVITTRLIAGNTTAVVLSDSNPNDKFFSIKPELEHVYFANINAEGQCE